MTDSPYFNRELSWLEFNQRVLDEARNSDVPLLERLKFLAITASNLDEFRMVRVGGLRQLSARGSSKRDPTGLTAEQQLQHIRARLRELISDQYACLADELMPGMAEAGIHLLRPDELSERQLSAVESLFDRELSAVLTPMAISAETELPLLTGRVIHLCARLTPEEEGDDFRFAIIPLLGPLQRLLTLPSERGHDLLLLEDALQTLAGQFFPGEELLEIAVFRITRNADMSVREDSAADLLAEMEEVLDARKESDCVSLELAADASDETRTFLQGILAISDHDTYPIPGPLDLSAFMQLADIGGFESLKYDTWTPQACPDVDPSRSMFATLAERDLLLHHPYESFEPVVRLIDEAAADPDVLAIKQTLYRTSRNSPIVRALQRAAEKGKNVTALVEVKARFDEARNIEWAKNLEQSQVQVIYGVRGLKTHAKLCVVVRREPGGIRRYVHFGTGNYNESTARLYGDVSYLTANDEFGADATSFFNAISGYSQPQEFNRIDAAPIGLRERLLEMIEIERQHRKQGDKARIVAKLNSLVDPEIIQALYAASKVGVDIRLNVRGICCLRPGVPGLSENIQVISIVDRYLEHARMFYFWHGGDERVFISSADWMPRNLDRRIELLVPIDDAASRRKLLAILEMYFQDTVKARRLLPNGSYERVEPRSGEEPVRSQAALYQQTCAAAKLAAQAQANVFEPHLSDQINAGE